MLQIFATPLRRKRHPFMIFMIDIKPYNSSIIFGESKDMFKDMFNDNDKIEIAKQWNNDPCGAETVSVSSFSNKLDYYRAIRKHRYEEYAPWLLKAFPFNEIKNKKVLEIGVGLGSDHYNFAIHSNQMTMLDLSRKHLELTDNHMSLEGLKSDPVYGDAESAPFESNKFDVVYSFGVLHHTPNTEKAISEVYRILKPGGYAYIGLYNKKSWFFILNVFLWQGILKGNFIRKGWKKTLSLIEHRKDESTSLPLVKVYTKKECQNLFKKFDNTKISTYHVDYSDFIIFDIFKVLRKLISRKSIEKYLSFGGWYLVIHCRKPI